MKYHNFRGRKFKIFFGPIKNRNHLGTCDEGSKEIEIRSTLEGEELLDCLIHEALHACFPDIVDGAINDSATSIASFLGRLGYRREDEQTSKKTSKK